MADVNSTFKVYISTDPVFKVYVNNGAKGDSGIDGIDGQNGEGVASGGFTGQFLIKLSEEDFDTGWSNIDSTQVSYGDGTVSEGLDNRYTKGETDLLLDDKSDVGHTHDDRYFTETEVGVLLSGKSDTSHIHDGRYYTETETDALLSGKSDTTHNHDLTYAPIVHTHDDIYYTDDEVDTLLLSKSDTTHTHDLIKNATEANAKIEASSTGAVITRNVNDANIALRVNQQQGTGRIADFQFGGTSKAYIDRFGAFFGVGLSNYLSSANSYVDVGVAGTSINRNIADANPALIVNQANASSTGNILDLQFGGVSKAYVSRTGNITAGYLFTPNGMGNSTTMNNALVSVPSTGTRISRDVADTNSVLTVDNVHASSSGYLLNLQTQGVTKAFISREGVLYGSGIFNLVASSNSKIDTGLNGVVLTRNVADANPALKVNQQNASSTGNIAEFQFNGTTKLAIDKNGLLPATNVTNTPSGNISATTVQGAINELDTEKADKLMATNLVTNGDFSNGTTGWSNAGSGLVWYVSNNEAIITNLGTGPTYKLYQLLTATIGNVYYGRFYLSSNSSSDGIMVASSTTKYHSGSGNYEPLSIRHTASVTSTDFRLYSSRTGDISENPIKIKYALLLNLTSIFGAGKEPSKEQMDNMLSTFTNSWFNGTAELVSIANLAQLKADKTQEAWITPTLLNGWVNRLAERPLRYRKDGFGIVHLSGQVKSGTITSVIASLPAGYRPNIDSVFATATYSAAGSTASAEITIYVANGNIEVSRGSTIWVSLDGVTFSTT